MGKSEAEELFMMQIEASGLPVPEREYQFHPTRRWRFDFAWDDSLAVEVEGGSWVSGRHTRGKGFEADCEKYNAAMAWGWTVYRVTPAMVESGEALRILRYEFGEIEREEVDGTKGAT